MIPAQSRDDQLYELVLAIPSDGSYRSAVRRRRLPARPRPRPRSRPPGHPRPGLAAGRHRRPAAALHGPRGRQQPRHAQNRWPGLSRLWNWVPGRGAGPGCSRDRTGRRGHRRGRGRGHTPRFHSSGQVGATGPNGPHHGRGRSGPRARRRRRASRGGSLWLGQPHRRIRRSRRQPGHVRRPGLASQATPKGHGVGSVGPGRDRLGVRGG
jgi:hypothetical protein